MKIVDLKVQPGAEPVFVEGSDKGILFLHGFTSSPYEMKYLVEFFKKEGWTLSVPLLSGHGTKPDDLATHDWYQWFEDAKNSLFQLRKKCRKIVVAGLSTGATLALHLAAHYQVEGVVAMSPAFILKEKKLRWLPWVKPFKKYSYKKEGPDIKDELERKEAVTYHKTPLKAIEQLLKLYEHVKMDLPDVYVPLLVVQSEKDHVVHFASAEYVYDHVSSQDKHFLKLKESYHVVTLDVEKEIVIREIDHFVRGIFGS